MQLEIHCGKTGSISYYSKGTCWK